MLAYRGPSILLANNFVESYTWLVITCSAKCAPTSVKSNMRDSRQADISISEMDRLRPDPGCSAHGEGELLWRRWLTARIDVTRYESMSKIASQQ